MKKIFLTLAGSLLISVALFAQERGDTTGTQTNDPSTNYRRSDTRDQESGVQSQSPAMQGKSDQGQSMDWRYEESEAVSRENLPSELVETLKSEEYQGWENATIYRNKVSDDYMLVIQDNGRTRTFYFDKAGQPHQYNSSDDQSSSSGQIQSGATQSTGTESETSQENPNNSNATGATSTSSGTTTPSGASSSTLGEQPSATGTATEEQPSSVGSTDQPALSTEQPSTSWRAEDRVVIMSNDIPASLRVTLEDDAYRGWENSTIYRNRQSNEYMIEIRDGSNSKIYYFDKDGKALQISGPEEN